MNLACHVPQMTRHPRPGLDQEFFFPSSSTVKRKANKTSAPKKMSAAYGHAVWTKDHDGTVTVVEVKLRFTQSNKTTGFHLKIKMET